MPSGNRKDGPRLTSFPRTPTKNGQAATSQPAVEVAKENESESLINHEIDDPPDPLTEIVEDVKAFYRSIMQTVAENPSGDPKKAGKEAVKRVKTQHESEGKTEQETNVVDKEVTPKKTRKGKAIKNIEETNLVDERATPAKTRKRKAVKNSEEAAEQVDGEEKPKVKRKRKTKEEKEAEAMPLAARSVGLRMFIGAHVSGAKGASETGHSPMYLEKIKPDIAGVQSRSTKFRDKLRSYWVLHTIPTHNSYPLRIALTSMKWQCLRRVPQIPA